MEYAYYLVLYYSGSESRAIDYDLTRIETIQNIKVDKFPGYEILETTYDYSTQMPLEYRILISDSFLHAIVDRHVEDESLMAQYIEFSELIFEEEVDELDNPEYFWQTGTQPLPQAITMHATKLLNDLKEKLRYFHDQQQKAESLDNDPLDNTRDEFEKPYKEYNTPYEELLSEFLASSVLGKHPAIMLLHKLLDEMAIDYQCLD
jgi:hypothetical protein